MKIVEDKKFAIRKEKIYRFLGQKNKTVSGRLSKQIEKCINHLDKKIHPRILFTTRKIQKIENDTLALEGDVKLKSAKLSKTLSNCDSITFFLATIGGQIDDVINTSMRKKRISDAYIYDTIGSAAVEESVEEFQKRMDSTVKGKNKSTTLRFSPGYCDWHIKEQKKLFNVLKNDLIDVKLNENYLMTPSKSVSGVFGIGESGVIDKDETNPCRLCGMYKCIARRE